MPQASLHFFHNAVSHMKPHVAPSCNNQLKNSPATSHEVLLQQYLSMVNKERMQDVMKSLIFICRTAPLDSDDPCHELFLCDSSLDCDSHVEAEFYICFAGSTLEIGAMLSLRMRVGYTHQHEH